MMNGSQACGPSGDQRTPRLRRTHCVGSASPFPSPLLSPASRIAHFMKRQIRAGLHPPPCCCRGRLSPEQRARHQKLNARPSDGFAAKAGWKTALRLARSDTWAQGAAQTRSRLSMNRKVGQASRLPPSATPTERNRSRWRARWAGETPALHWALSTVHGPNACAKAKGIFP